MPVGFEVARSLHAPLDVLLVKKLGVPGHKELAMGAVATNGVRLLNLDVVENLKVPDEVIEALSTEELRELARRERVYRGSRPPPDVSGRTVILVDDGLATGATMRVAVAALRRQCPARVVVAVPVSAAQACDHYKVGADEIVCAVTPEPFHAVGQWYEDFSQTTDEEVRSFLEQASRIRAASAGHD